MNARSPPRRFRTYRIRRLTVVAAVLVGALLAVGPAGGTPVSRTSGTDVAAAAVVAGPPQRPADLDDPAIHIILPHPTWINVTNTTAGAHPTTAFGGTSAYDPEDNETVYFGGCIDYNCSIQSNQTWVFAHGVWTNETNPSDAPPAREYASMDYDPNMQEVLLFGGLSDLYGYLNDTWLFRGGVWTNVTSWGPGPIGRFGAAMAFDPAPEENGSVLFGGYSALSLTGYLNDTWVWQGGAGWVQLTPSIAPPGTVYGDMAYDPVSGYIVLFGGDNASFATTDQTWEFYSGQWWSTRISPSPSARNDEMMTWVPSISAILMFGGENALAYELNDTWTFANNVWTNITPSSSPPEREGSGFALDGTGVTPILVGGFNIDSGAVFNDTWAYEYAPGASFVTSVSSAEVSENVTLNVTADGGTAPYQVSLSFGDGSNAFAESPGPTILFYHAYSHPGSYNVSVTSTDAVGDSTAYGPVAFPVTAGPAIAAKATPGTTDVNSPIAFNASITSPGATPFSFSWDFGDASPNATTQNASHAFANPGTYAVTVVATDADHSTATASLSVTIVAAPALTVAATPTKPGVGVATTFFANVSGGTAPYSFSWAFGDGHSSAFPAPQHSFAAAGTYTAQVWVNDSVGSSMHGSIQVTVGSSSSGSSGFGNAPDWFWAVIVALAAVAVVGSVLLARRGRTKPPSTGPPTPWVPSEASVPGTGSPPGPPSD
jgi:PKD repeat protein